MGVPGEMLETVVQEKVVPGGTPVPVKKSRLSTKMAAVVAGAGATGKENSKVTKNEGQAKAPEGEKSPKEEEPKNVTNVETSSPPPLPDKGFRMDEPAESSMGEGGRDEEHGSQNENAVDDGTTILQEE